MCNCVALVLFLPMHVADAHLGTQLHGIKILKKVLLLGIFYFSMYIPASKVCTLCPWYVLYSRFYWRGELQHGRGETQWVQSTGGKSGNLHQQCLGDHMWQPTQLFWPCNHLSEPRIPFHWCLPHPTAWHSLWQWTHLPRQPWLWWEWRGSPQLPLFCGSSLLLSWPRRCREMCR